METNYSTVNVETIKRMKNDLEKAMKQKDGEVCFDILRNLEPISIPAEMIISMKIGKLVAEVAHQFARRSTFLNSSSGEKSIC